MEYMANDMDFSMIWGSNAPSQYEFTPENYMLGWYFVGSVPPSRTMFDAWMRNADLKMQWLYNNAFSESSLGGFLFWRLPSTAYFVGDLRQLQNGPLDVYLKCTMAGMSSEESITDLPEGKNVGDSWEDGSVTWEIMQFSSSDSMADSITAHNTDTDAHKDFVGATAEKAGVRGMVPAPAAGGESKVLTGGKVWSLIEELNVALGTIAAPTADTAALKTLLGGIAYVLKEITGESDWKGNPKINLATLATLVGNLSSGSDVTWYGQKFTNAKLGVSGLMAQNGYIQFGKNFGGLIVQWILLQESSGTVSYPLSATVLAMATGLNRQVAEPQALGLYDITASTFSFNQVQQNGGNPGMPIALPCWVIAICKNTVDKKKR